MTIKERIAGNTRVIVGCDNVLKLAQTPRGTEDFGYCSDFASLVNLVTYHRGSSNLQAPR